MPPREPGYCDCCGEFSDGLVFVMGYNPEPGLYQRRIYGGWVCAQCFVALAGIREEQRKAREKRKPGADPAGRAGAGTGSTKGRTRMAAGETEQKNGGMRP